MRATTRWSVVAGVALAWLGGSGVPIALAQDTPEAAQQLVVGIRVVYEAEGSTQAIHGAGIVFGLAHDPVNGDTVYVATADHVLRDPTGLGTIWVRFQSHPNDSARAFIRHRTVDPDLAVIAVPTDALPRDASGALAIPLEFDWRAQDGYLAREDDVRVVGCPNGVCWGPTATEEVLIINGGEITFQTQSVAVGNSGGALFNEWWEIAGMAFFTESSMARAYPIERVMRDVEARDFPVNLIPRSIPRGGYRTSVGISALLGFAGSTLESSGGVDLGPYLETRAPSLRATYRQRRGSFEWHLGLLRLAPDNLAVHAGIAGAGLVRRMGRFEAHAFVEGGIGSTEARWLANEYTRGGEVQPIWEKERGSGIGVGAGFEIDFTIRPQLILSSTGGVWRFDAPELAPDVPPVFAGIGIRWGLRSRE